MSIYSPYTYLIGWTKYNIWYYGVRFAKGCHPDDLWKIYFSSSKKVLLFRKDYGEPDVISIRKIFKTGKQACLWEEKVLRRIDITNSKWLNANVAGAIDPSKAIATKIKNNSTNKGKKFPNRKRYSQETKEKFKGPKSEEHKQKLRKPKSEEHKEKLKSPRLNARKPRGSYKKRKKYTEEQIKIIYASRRGEGSRGKQKNPDPTRYRKRGPEANKKGWETRRKRKNETE